MKIDKVLVVDDSKVAHLTLRKMLTERGIEVDWVGSGEDSLTYLKQQQPNLIFMDVMMPGMDGFETTTAIKSNQASAATPIVMCSANTTSEDKENAAKLGAVDFLSKPYTAEELDTVLEKIRALTGAHATVAKRAPAAAPAEVASPSLAREGGHLHQAEQAAWATADRVAREVAGDIARTCATAAAKEAAEHAARKAAQAATQAAKAHAEKLIQSAATDISRNVTDEVMRSVNTMIVQKLAEQKVTTPDPSKLRGEIQRELEQQVGRHVEEAVSEAMGGDAVREQLSQLVQQRAIPTVEETARRIATQSAEEVVSEAMEDTGGVSKVGVLALVLSLAALAGVAGLIFLQMG